MKLRVFSTIIMMYLAVFTVNAQKEATLKSFTQTTDHISSSDRRKDLNGTPCALVKIQVVDDIERIEGNKIGNIINRGVEKWVYMCAGSRNMRIHLKNHLPVKVMFHDYHINGLESNRVYELVLETPDVTAVNTTNNSNQKLIINYSPAHATVMVDSKLCNGNGRIEMALPVGEHKYIIAANGYVTAEGTVKLNEHAPRTITEDLALDTQSASTNIYNKRVQDNTVYVDSGSKDQYGQAEPNKDDYFYQKKEEKTKLPKTLKWNFRAGYSFDNMTGDSELSGVSGFDASVGITMPFGYKGLFWGVDVGIMTYGTHCDDGDISVFGADIAPKVGITIPLKQKMALNVYGGPYVGYIFDGDWIYQRVDLHEDVDVGVNLGVELFVSKKVFFDLHVKKGFMSLGETYYYDYSDISSLKIVLGVGLQF